MLTNQRLFLAGVLLTIAGVLVLFAAIKAGAWSFAVIGFVVIIGGLGLMAVQLPDGGNK